MAVFYGQFLGLRRCDWVAGREEEERQPMRTSHSHPLQIAEVKAGPGMGKLGLTFCPGKQQLHAASGAWCRDLGLDVAEIARWNAAAVVTLIEDHELASLGVVALGDVMRDAHMTWFHLPIRDVGVPDARFEEAWLGAGIGEVEVEEAVADIGDGIGHGAIEHHRGAQLLARGEHAGIAGLLEADLREIAAAHVDAAADQREQGGDRRRHERHGVARAVARETAEQSTRFASACKRSGAALAFHGIDELRLVQACDSPRGVTP